MIRLRSILASGAVAVGLTHAIGLAQVPRVGPPKGGVSRSASTPAAERRATPQPPIEKPAAEAGRARAPAKAGAGMQNMGGLSKRTVSAASRRRNMANQLRPFYRHELMQVRAACGLTRERLREIRSESDAAYEAAIDEITDGGSLLPPSTANASPAPRWQAGGPADYHRIIRESILAVVRRHVTAEQWDALQAEIRLREAGRKEAGIEFLVALIDRELSLTGRQREQIAGSLAAHWDDRWCEALEMALGGSRIQVPRMPDHLVLPFLSASQQETWRDLPKFDGLLWGAAIDHGGDDDLEQELGADPNSNVNRPAIRRRSRPMIIAPKDAARDGFTGRE